MKRVAMILLIGLITASLGANLITQNEALVSAALKELRFESQPTKGGVVGAPPRFRVTKQTIEHLDKLMKDGKAIEIQANGELKIR
jgi:hypothetical protein